MSIIDQAIKANRKYSHTHNPKLAERPYPKIAVVTCMDPRLSHLPEILGVPHADIDVIRTGGPAVTEDVLSELVVSTRVLGAKEIPVRGFVFDMATGLLSEVVAVAQETAA
jgi:carbonic anhydrase